MKPLVLLSFSLTFLMQGFADDYSPAAPSEQPNTQQNDASTPQPSQPANAEKNSGNQVMTGDSSTTVPSDQQPQSTMAMESDDSPEWCLSPYHEFHASIRHNEANGIGYKDGYTTLEVFGIYDEWGSGFMPFFDVRGHIFNNGYLAGNVGIGERTLLESINHTFGSYLYYDVRRVGHGLTVNQLSPGIELVGERMEYRINGYFPVGKQKGHEYGFNFDKFSGHSIILKGKQQQAMTGFDAEVGIHIPQSTIYDVYAAAGPYYFKSSNAQSWGGKVRLLGRYKEYVTLEVNYSYDRLFRNVVQGSLAFTLPFGRKLQRCGRCCPQTDYLLLSRASFAPSRFEIPVVKRVNKREKAINPATGQPWVVWFVNNTSHSAGTFESPFPTLLQAQNASSQSQMIYVFPGDGTTKGMNAGITLQNGQSFFGSGIAQQFSTTKGTMTIPAMSSTNPTITTTTGNVVTIGNGNVVSGFNVSSVVASSFGIGSSAPVNGATIMNNNVTATSAVAGTSGILVTGFGPVNISNNQVTGSTANALLIGINVFGQGGVMSGTISNNFTSGFDFAIVLNSPPTNPGSYDMSVEGNTVTGYVVEGIETSMLRTSTIRVIGNTVMTNSDFSAAAIVVIDDPSTISGRFTIADNQVTVGALAGNFGIDFFSNNQEAWNLSALVTNNSVQGLNSTFTGYNFVVANTDKLCLTLDNNIVVNPTAGSTAFNFNATAGTINIDSIQGNVGGPVSSTGNVNLVAPGTCGN
jgi:hypothetical protein